MARVVLRCKPFSLDVGPTIPLDEDPTVIFMALFTPQLLEHVVETNRYATLCLTSTHKGEGPPLHGKQIERSKRTWGLLVLMGINKEPDFYNYRSVPHIRPISTDDGLVKYLC